MALLANCHRDPKRSKAFTPADFMPQAGPIAKPPPLPGDISVLKCFLRGPAARKASP